MTQYPLYRRLGGPHGQCRWVQKSWPPPGLDPQTLQLIVSHCIDYAIPAQGCDVFCYNIVCTHGITICIIILSPCWLHFFFGRTCVPIHFMEMCEYI
jgi:hypothetical protein